MPFTLDDFNFDLPPALIAQHPTAQRSASRLLDARQDQPAHRVFHELPRLLQAGDLLVFNDTQVIKARLHGRKTSGGQIELLVERVLPDSTEVWAQVRASKSPQAGSQLQLGDPSDPFNAEVLGRCGPDDSLFHLRWPADPLKLMSRYGHVPLPPYITHDDTADDAQRYQTVFARRPGAVAAPTAALHFDEALLEALSLKGIERAHVTLHVGAGTFQPVRTQALTAHRMHSEWYDIPATTVQAIQSAHARGARVVAVGTTTLRALESAALGGALRAGARETDIFITPGFSFQVVDTLITNFHLPKSTLLMLISAFAGHEKIKALYAHAIEHHYRFFSYGDAMLLQRSMLK